MHFLKSLATYSHFKAWTLISFRTFTEILNFGLDFIWYVLRVFFAIEFFNRPNKKPAIRGQLGPSRLSHLKLKLLATP